jgi:predicted transglutaminase-like cysteine proteinase
MTRPPTRPYEGENRTKQRRLRRIPAGIAAACLLAGAALAMAERLGAADKLLAYVGDRYGAPARDRVQEWRQLIGQDQGKPELEKLRRVNHFFNQVNFVSDLEHWGKGDYWATPVELLSTNGGDCEDFTIAKYFTLKEMGVPEQRMQITYVKALSLNQAHMVLTYFPTPGADPLVLDNLIDEIKPASQRSDLLPVYSFNGEGLWLAKRRGRGERVGGSGRIGLWRDLNTRMNNEGTSD